jgi:hypothetical protein
MPTANHRIRTLINDLQGALDRARGVSVRDLRRAEYLLAAGRLDLLLSEGLHARMLRARRQIRAQDAAAADPTTPDRRGISL